MKRARPKTLGRKRVRPFRKAATEQITRAEYNALIASLNQGRAVLDDIDAAITELRRDRDVQFKRTAQIQADLDEIRRAWKKSASDRTDD